MQMRTLRLDDQPEVVKQFFREMGEGVTVVELAGRPLAILSPADPAQAPAHGLGSLRDSAGKWNLPLELARVIAGDEVQEELNGPPPTGS